MVTPVVAIPEAPVLKTVKDYFEVDSSAYLASASDVCDSTGSDTSGDAGDVDDSDVLGTGLILGSGSGSGSGSGPDPDPEEKEASEDHIATGIHFHMSSKTFCNAELAEAELRKCIHLWMSIPADIRSQLPNWIEDNGGGGIEDFAQWRRAVVVTGPVLEHLEKNVREQCEHGLNVSIQYTTLDTPMQLGHIVKWGFKMVNIRWNIL
jgi:hypothetical protein